MCGSSLCFGVFLGKATERENICGLYAKIASICSFGVFFFWSRGGGGVCVCVCVGGGWGCKCLICLVFVCVCGRWG